MTRRKTTLERIAAIREKMALLQKKVRDLQDACPHVHIMCECRIVGYNGYSNDYTTHCRCKDCEKGWFHDGYCLGECYTQHGKAAVVIG